MKPDTDRQSFPLEVIDGPKISADLLAVKFNIPPEIVEDIIGEVLRQLRQEDEDRLSVVFDQLDALSATREDILVLALQTIMRALPVAEYQYHTEPKADAAGALANLVDLMTRLKERLDDARGLRVQVAQILEPHLRQFLSQVIRQVAEFVGQVPDMSQEKLAEFGRQLDAHKQDLLDRLTDQLTSQTAKGRRGRKP